MSKSSYKHSMDPFNQSSDTLFSENVYHSTPQKPHTEFLVKVSDGGHTSVKISLFVDGSEDNSAIPTCVKVRFACLEFSDRRISSISVHITALHADVVDVHPRKKVELEGETTNFVVSKKEASSVGLRSIGLTGPTGVGFNVDTGKERTIETEEKKKGTRTSYRTVLGNFHGDTARFMLKEAKVAWGGNGLGGDHEGMCFYLNRRINDQFKFYFDCRIAYFKGNEEKTRRVVSRGWFRRIRVPAILSRMIICSTKGKRKGKRTGYRRLL